MIRREFWVYILASRRNGTIYIGITNDLYRRIQEHRGKLNKHSFTTKYVVQRLVYYEFFSSVYEAIQREKQLKHWKRKWKIMMIESTNPEWQDLLG